MSSDHTLRHAHEANRNEFAARRRFTGDGVLGPYLDPIRGELHRLVQEEPGLAFAGPDVLFQRLTVPETAPGFASCLKRAALGVLLVRAVDRAEGVRVDTGGDAA